MSLVESPFQEPIVDETLAEQCNARSAGEKGAPEYVTMMCNRWPGGARRPHG